MFYDVFIPVIDAGGERAVIVTCNGIPFQLLPSEMNEIVEINNIIQGQKQSTLLVKDEVRTTKTQNLIELYSLAYMEVK